MNRRSLRYSVTSALRKGAVSFQKFIFSPPMPPSSDISASTIIFLIVLIFTPVYFQLAGIAYIGRHVVLPPNQVLYVVTSHKSPIWRYDAKDLRLTSFIQSIYFFDYSSIRQV